MELNNCSSRLQKLLLSGRRWLPTATLVIGGLFLVSPKAHAAHWQITYMPDGSDIEGTTTERPWYQGMNAYNYDPQTGRLAADYNGQVNFFGWAMNDLGAMGVSGSTHLPTSATSKGSVTVYLKWVQDEYDDPPVAAPKMVVLNISGNANSASSGPSDLTTLTANARFGKLSVPGTLFVGPPDMRSALAYANSIPVPLTVNQQGEAQYTFSLGSKATTSTFESWSNDQVYSGAMTEFHANPSPLWVAISSDMEQSWYKWDKHDPAELPDAYKYRDPVTHQLTNQADPAKAERVAGQLTTNDMSDDIWRLACLRDADGSMTVESAANPSLGAGALDAQGNPTTTTFWYGGGVFTGYSEGVPNPTYTWDVGSTTGFHTGNPLVLVGYNNNSNPFGPSYLDLGIGATLQVHSTTVTVNVPHPYFPNINLSSNYNINWHEPRENWQNYGPTNSYWQYPTVDIASPGYSISGGSIAASYVLNGDYWGNAVGTAWTTLTTVGASSLPLPYSGLSAAASLTHIGTQSVTTLVPFNDHWGEITSTYEPYRDDTKKSFYQMTPELRVGYNVKFWDGEVYGHNGYAGQEQKAIAKRNGAEEWIAKFTLTEAEED